MRLYILVHHKLNPSQPWQNGWLDGHLANPAFLDYIFTKPALAQECEAERVAGNAVFIHRTRYKSSQRIICAEANIASVDLLTNRVSFSNHQPLNDPPIFKASQGQIWYRKS